MAGKLGRSKITRVPPSATVSEVRRELIRRRLALLRTFLSKHPMNKLTSELVFQGVPIGHFARSCRYRYRQGDLSPWLTADWRPSPAGAGRFLVTQMKRPPM